MPEANLSPRDPRADAYPLPRYPKGWYGVLRSQDLRPGKAVPLHYFGRELVAFREHGGVAAVLDAYCPHYGAHLGHGGVVRDGAIECPFHGWRFAGDGRCVHAPFARRAPSVAVRAWPVREVNGILFVHHDRGGGAPTYEIPTLPEDDRSAWGHGIHEVYRMRSHIQELRENLVDESHFCHIHGLELPQQEFRPEGPVAHLSQRVRRRILGVPFDVEFHVEMYGPGLAVARSIGTLFTHTTLALTTPVNDQLSEMRLLHLFPRSHMALPRTLMSHLVFHLLARPQVALESRIWDAKVYQERPIFLPHERGILRLRRWYRQFYDE